MAILTQRRKIQFGGQPAFLLTGIGNDIEVSASGPQAAAALAAILDLIGRKFDED